MQRRLLTVQLTLAALFCLVLVASALAYRKQRQQRLNQELITACKHLDVSAVRQMLRAGASPDAVDFSEWPRPSLRDYLQRLFTHNPDPTPYRRVAMEVAFEASPLADDDRERKLTPIIALLLEAGARPNVRNILGETVVDRASEFRYSRGCALLLLKQGVRLDNPNRCLVQACEDGDLETIQLLLKRGADPNATARLCCVYVSTPLQSAVFRNRPAITSYLLQHGADPNQRIDNSFTLLPVAKQLHETAIVALLKKAGAKESFR